MTLATEAPVATSIGARPNADESTRVVAEWLREEKLEAALPNPPKITDGTVIVQEL